MEFSVEKAKELVRPVITFMLSGTLVYGFVTDKITGEVFVPFVTMVLMYWFKSRDEQKG